MLKELQAVAERLTLLLAFLIANLAPVSPHVETCWVRQCRGIVPHVGVHVPRLRVVEADHIFAARVRGEPAAHRVGVGACGRDVEIPIAPSGVLEARKVHAINIPRMRPKLAPRVEKDVQGHASGLIGLLSIRAQMVGVHEKRVAGPRLGHHAACRPDVPVPPAARRAVVVA